MEFLSTQTSICRYAMAMGSSCAQELNSSLLLHDLTVCGTSRFSTAIPSRQFSSLRISPAPKLHFCSSPSWVLLLWYQEGTIPPELVGSDSLKYLSHTQIRVEFFQVLCTNSHSSPCSPLLWLTAEISTPARML
jgi:hypothetical protein